VSGPPDPVPATATEGPVPATAAATEDRARAGRRRGRALLPGLVGGVLLLVTSAQAWWRATGDGVHVGFTGNQSTAGLSQALGVVALAGWLLVLVLRTRGRRVVGVLLALTGLGTALVGALRQRPSATSVRNQVREVTLADSFELVPSAWPHVYAAAGLLVLACGLLTVLTAGSWPRRADRYARTTTRVASTTAADDPAAVWRAQDAGLDPTTRSPDVRIEGAEDTMGGADDHRTPSPD